MSISGKFDFLFLCPHWGSKDLPFEYFISKVKNAGYDGIEMSLPFENDKLRDKMVHDIKSAELLFIGQHWETITVNFQDHKEEFKTRLYNLACGKPLLIDSQTGRDFFSFEQNMELVHIATQFTKETGIPVVHETHRSKFTFAAHITAQFLKANPDLRIGADFSHWCNVAETMLVDQEEAMNLAISRADHIHARIGFTEGPQIPDPRAIEWEDVVAKHLSWWDRIIDRAKQEGKDFFTITPEFGPYPYMTILPHTQQPIADQWDINVYMMNLLRARYNK